METKRERYMKYIFGALAILIVWFVVSVVQYIVGGLYIIDLPQSNLIGKTISTQSGDVYEIRPPASPEMFFDQSSVRSEMGDGKFQRITANSKWITDSPDPSYKQHTYTEHSQVHPLFPGKSLVIKKVFFTEREGLVAIDTSRPTLWVIAQDAEGAQYLIPDSEMFTSYTGATERFSIEGDESKTMLTTLLTADLDKQRYRNF